MVANRKIYRKYVGKNVNVISVFMMAPISKEYLDRAKQANKNLFIISNDTIFSEVWKSV